MRALVRLCLGASLLFTAVAEEKAPAGKPVLGAWGIETQHISKTVRPGDDFYRFVNEGWLATAKPPPGLPYANAFTDAFLRTQGQLTEMMATINAGTFAAGSDEQMIGALYQSYVDMKTRDALGMTPIKAEVDALLTVATREDAARWMARPFVRSFIGTSPDTDAKMPQRYVLSAFQAGLGLPGPEFYLKPEEPFAGHRVAYRDYIKATFDRAGISDGAARAEAILALESEIARRHWTLEQQRDPVKTYHLMSIDDLKAYAPGFPWDVYLGESGYAAQREIVLNTDTSVQALARLFGETPVETLQSYLAFHYIDTFAPVLSAEYEEASFQFFGARLQGTPEQQSVENRALMFLNKNLGEILGRAYAARYFKADTKAIMDALVTNVRAAFKARLEANDWMDEPTRKEALAKLEAVVSRIGYPDKYRDYATLMLKPGDLVGNWRRIADFNHADALKLFGEKRRDWSWPYPASEINAGYSPQTNTITFPAGILQSPFFDPNADPAVNYGAIGAVIGHELGHGFDDQGSQSDGSGTLRDWWTPAARAEFKKRTDVLVAQFNAYSPIEGMNVNGALTLGENIGDLGGLSIGYEAYKRHVATLPGGQDAVIDGFTGDQRFFLSWGQLWRDYTAPDMARQNLLTDVHSPSEFRAATVRNFDPWYAAFGVKDGDRMYLPPEKRVSIW